MFNWPNIIPSLISNKTSPATTKPIAANDINTPTDEWMVILPSSDSGFEEKPLEDLERERTRAEAEFQQIISDTSDAETPSIPHRPPKSKPQSSSTPSVTKAKGRAKKGKPSTVTTAGGGVGMLQVGEIPPRRRVYDQTIKSAMTTGGMSLAGALVCRRTIESDAPASSKRAWAGAENGGHDFHPSARTLSFLENKN
ncbi:hypothetical protein BC832DRAFT_540464 [Gaertneriomyces semiglobifer]|nr:hypothetical protein BC832DRAFT_540464 [Gaertneriomyces semiglobifer]